MNSSNSNRSSKYKSWSLLSICYSRGTWYVFTFNPPSVLQNSYVFIGNMKKRKLRKIRSFCTQISQLMSGNQGPWFYSPNYLHWILVPALRQSAYTLWGYRKIALLEYRLGAVQCGDVRGSWWPGNPLIQPKTVLCHFPVLSAWRMFYSLSLWALHFPLQTVFSNWICTSADHSSVSYN